MVQTNGNWYNGSQYERADLTRAAIESQSSHQRTFLCYIYRPQYRRATATSERAIMAPDKAKILEFLSSVTEYAILMDVALATVQCFWN